MKFKSPIIALCMLIAFAALPQTAVAGDKVKQVKSAEHLKHVAKDGTVIKQGDHKLKKVDRERLQSQSGKPAPKPKPTPAPKPKPKPKPDPEPCNDGSGTDPDCDDDEDEDRDVDTDNLRDPARVIQGM